MSKVDLGELRDTICEIRIEARPPPRITDLLHAAADELASLRSSVAQLEAERALARAVVEAAQAHIHYNYCSAQIGCDKCACPGLCGALAAYRAHVGGTGK